MTTKQKLSSFPFHLPWNLLPVPSLTRLLLALTTSPSLILPGTLDSFLTQACPWRSTSEKSVKLLITSLNALVQSAGFSRKTQPGLLLLPISSRGFYCNCLLKGTPNLTSPENSKLCCKTSSLGTPPPTLNTSLWKKRKNCTGFPFQNVLSIKSLVCVSVL